MTSRVAPPADPSIELERVLPARTRLGQYDIERVIAISAFAVVYRACERVNQRMVAIKEYLPDALAIRNSKGRVSPRSPRDAVRFELGRKAFVGESRTLARFEHPSLLRVLGLLEANGTVYRVMRFTPGPTLLEHRKALGATPILQDFRRWLDGLLGALSALHDKGCTHGSVVPANILLRPHKWPVLLDFGAVRKVLAYDHTVTEPASDLHSLAGTLHYAISGEWPAAPLECNAPMETATHYVPLADGWQRARGCSPTPCDVEKVFGAIDACLAAAPQQRPQSAAEFRKWLCRGGAAPSPPLPASATAELDADRSEATWTGIAATVDTAADDAQASVVVPAAAQGPGAAEPGTGVVDLLNPSAPMGAEVPTQADAAPVPTQVVAAPAGLVAAGDGWWWRAVWTAGLALTLSIGLGFWWSRPGADSAPPPPVPVRAVAPPIEARHAPAALSPPPLNIVESPDAGLPEPGPSAEVPVQPMAVSSIPAAVKARMKAVAPAAARSPRQVCSQGTGFALYQCMQLQCAKASWSGHAQCVRLRQSDALD